MDSGTYNLSAGTFSASFVSVGINNGIGVINQSGGQTSFASLSLANYGGTATFNLSAGTFSDSGPEIISAASSTGHFVQTGGTASAASVTINVGGSYAISGGSFSVDGPLTITSTPSNASFLISNSTVMAASVNNSGLISLGIPGAGGVAGNLDVTGNFTENSGSELDIVLGGPAAGSQYATLDIDDISTLAGTLKISLADGFEPYPGEIFNIITAGSESGTFSTVSLPRLNNLPMFTVDYSTTGVTLVAVPEPATEMLLCSAALCALSCRNKVRRGLVR
jgi:hypothetical protein